MMMAGPVAYGGMLPKMGAKNILQKKPVRSKHVQHPLFPLINVGRGNAQAGRTCGDADHLSIQRACAHVGDEMQKLEQCIVCTHWIRKQLYLSLDFHHQNSEETDEHPCFRTG